MEAQVKLSLKNGEEVSLSDATLKRLMEAIPGGAELIKSGYYDASAIVSGLAKEDLQLILDVLPLISEENKDDLKEYFGSLLTEKKFEEYGRLLIAADFLGINILCNAALEYVNANVFTWLKEKKLEVLKSLLELQGAYPYLTFITVDLKNKDGITPCMYAYRYGLDDVGEMLHNAGAMVKLRSSSPQIPPARSWIAPITGFLTDFFFDWKSSFTPQLPSGRSWVAPVKDLFGLGEKSAQKAKGVVLCDDTAKQVDIITQSILATAKNDEIFSHCMIYGPSGTGKTMLGKEMAQKLGLPYVHFTGNQEDAPRLLEELDGYDQSKCIIIIDDLDCLPPDLFELMIRCLGAQQKNYCVIGIFSIFRVDLNSALVSRFSERIEIKNPELQERVRLFAQALSNCLSDPPHAIDPNSNSLIRFLDSKPKEAYTTFYIAEDVFMEEVLQEFGELSEGLMGRDIIDHIMSSVQIEAWSATDRIITKEMIKERIRILHLAKSFFRVEGERNNAE